MSNKIGDRIRMIREVAGLTQQQLADAADFKHKGQICHYENDDWQPDMVSLRKLASGLGVTVETLLSPDRIAWNAMSHTSSGLAAFITILFNEKPILEIVTGIVISPPEPQIPSRTLDPRKGRAIRKKLLEYSRTTSSIVVLQEQVVGYYFLIRQVLREEHGMECNEDQLGKMLTEYTIPMVWNDKAVERFLKRNGLCPTYSNWNSLRLYKHGLWMTIHAGLAGELGCVEFGWSEHVSGSVCNELCRNLETVYGVVAEITESGFKMSEESIKRINARTQHDISSVRSAQLGTKKSPNR